MCTKIIVVVFPFFINKQDQGLQHDGDIMVTDARWPEKRQREEQAKERKDGTWPIIEQGPYI